MQVKDAAADTSPLPLYSDRAGIAERPRAPRGRAIRVGYHLRAGAYRYPAPASQDPNHTRVIQVTLPETTPVSEAAALQEDLRRAGIEPFGWVINKCLIASGTHDPLLRLRLAKERTQIARVQNGLTERAFMIGWQSKPPVGVAELKRLS